MDNNYEYSYLRRVLLLITKDLSNKIKFKYNFKNEPKIIEVPFYYKLTGDSQFLMDAFVDDVPGERVEFNHNLIPSGWLSLNSIQVKSEELRNPHVYLNIKIPNKDGIIQTFNSKVKFLPLELVIDVEVRLSNFLEYLKFTEVLWQTIFQHNFLYFEYLGLKSNVHYQLPDNINLDKASELTNGGDSTTKVTFSLEVNTNMPIISNYNLMENWMQMDNIQNEVILTQLNKPNTETLP